MFDWIKVFREYLKAEFHQTFRFQTPQMLPKFAHDQVLVVKSITQRYNVNKNNIENNTFVVFCVHLIGFTISLNREICFIIIFTHLADFV